MSEHSVDTHYKADHYENILQAFELAEEKAGLNLDQISITSETVGPDSSMYWTNPDDYTLHPIQAIPSVCILEDSLDMLEILGFIGDLPDVQIDDLRFKTLDERFNNDQNDVERRILEAKGSFEMSKIYWAKTRAHHVAIGEEILKNLRFMHSFKFMLKYVSAYKIRLLEEEVLIKLESENQKKLLKLCEELEDDRKKFQRNVQLKYEELGELKDKIEDMILYNEICEKYIDAWENARSEQNILRLNMEEDKLKNQQTELKMKTEREYRISEEIRHCLLHIITDHQLECIHWEEQLKKELEIRDMEITVLRETREEQFQRLEDLTALYNKKQNEIDEYLKYKSEKEERDIIAKKKNDAATKIQSWWKGMMVRHKLGEFNPRKNKKGKKAGKDKGGKKKK